MMSETPKTKRVAIFGAGFGGLAAAHQLLKESANNKSNGGEDVKYDIHIYERNPIAGGQARQSGSTPDDYSELCWHGIGHGYNHMLPLWSEIPSPQGGSVFDQLVPVSQFVIANRDPTGHKDTYEKNSFMEGVTLSSYIGSWFRGESSWSIHDLLFFARQCLMGTFCCGERLEATFQNKLWVKYVEENGLSPGAVKWARYLPAATLGMDVERLSAYTLVHFFRPQVIDSAKLGVDHLQFLNCVNGPFQLVVTDPWVEFLRSKGVTFHFNTSVHSVVVENGAVQGFRLVGDDLSAKPREADVFFDALCPFGMADVLKRTNAAAGCDVLPSGYLDRFVALARNSLQLQTQVSMFLPCKLDPDSYANADPNTKDTFCFYSLPDSPWHLLIRIDGPGMRHGEAGRRLTGKQELLSIGIGSLHVPGLRGKAARDCTRQEICEEVFLQMQQCAPAYSRNKMRLADGRYFASLSLSDIKFDIWSEYADKPDGSGVSTTQPKCSNGVHTLENRPDVVDEHFSNLYHANAMTQTETNIYCLESASESGIRAARGAVAAMAGKSAKEHSAILYPKLHNTWYYSIVHGLDRHLLWRFGLPHPTESWTGIVAFTACASATATVLWQRYSNNQFNAINTSLLKFVEPGFELVRKWLV